MPSEEDIREAVAQLQAELSSPQFAKAVNDIDDMFTVPKSHDFVINVKADERGVSHVGLVEWGGTPGSTRTSFDIDTIMEPTSREALAELLGDVADAIADRMGWR